MMNPPSPSPAELLGALDGHVWTDEDGDEQVIGLLPPLSPAEIDTLAEVWGAPLPPDAQGLLLTGRGVGGGPLDVVDFAGLSGGVDEEVFPFALSIAHDGFGNYWVVDLAPGSRVFGPVFFVCHDPPVVAWQCADVAAFLDALLEMTEPPHQGPLDHVDETVVTDIWRGEERTVTRDAAVRADDDTLRAFAASLPADARIADLRNAAVGDGFRVPLRSRVVRHPTKPIFAIHSRASATAGPRPKPGFLARLSGRG